MSRMMLTPTLEEAVESLSRGDHRSHALNVGKAAGFALTADLPGLQSLVVYDEISDAFENQDVDALVELRHSVVDLYRQSGIDESPIVLSNRDDRRYPTWDEYGSALNEALEAKNEGDSNRYSLMIGLVSGMMFTGRGSAGLDDRQAPEVLGSIRPTVGRVAGRLA